MTGRVPEALVVIRRLRARCKRLLVYTRVTRLIEGGNAQLLVRILLDDAEGVVVCVERRHEDERHIDLVGRVQVLDLTHGEVEEGHVVLDLESALCASHACCEQR